MQQRSADLAGEVIQASSDFDGRERSPMRLAEARITLGVWSPHGTGTWTRPSARDSALSAASADHYRPFLMASRDLTKLLNDRYPSETGTRQYLDQLHTVSPAPLSH